MDLEPGPHKRAINQDGGNLFEFLLGLAVFLLFTVEIFNPSKQTLDQGGLGVDLEDPLFLQELTGRRSLLVLGRI